MTHWAYDAVFYHIYPLGMCGAPARNDFSSLPEPRLRTIFAWLDHIQNLGCNALYLGPLFESSAHGYDTADYYHLDRRLGADADLQDLSREMHRRGMRLILDGVFNHVGRDFWAFRDLQQYGRDSIFRDWFAGLSFEGRSSYGDPFSYQGWNGNFDLVKLNLAHPHVRDHLFHAVRTWVEEFDIDGLRLDTADCLDDDFLRALSASCRSLRPNFWLMGEVIHGDYRRWANPAVLDSVTNYEVYKGLYSSHVDRNYFEIAYSLNRQFGEEGMYRGLPLYTFADNHDVNRVVSSLKDPAHVYPLYCLMYTIPGVPSIYYGSEWALEGRRTPSDDRALRPALDLEEARGSAAQKDLPGAIARLAQVRRSCPALRIGDYRQVYVDHAQFAFMRTLGEEHILTAVNADTEAVPFEVNLAGENGSLWRDLLNPGDIFTSQGGRLRIDGLPPRWGRILRRENQH